MEMKSTMRKMLQTKRADIKKAIETLDKTRSELQTKKRNLDFQILELHLELEETILCFHCHRKMLLDEADYWLNDNDALCQICAEQCAGEYLNLLK